MATFLNNIIAFGVTAVLVGVISMRRMIDYDKLLDLRFALADGRYGQKPPDCRDESFLTRPAKKKKKQKPQKIKVEIEDVSDGKL